MSSVVVVPTYNEAGSITEVIERVLAATDSDILIVDDNSPDGTGALVRGSAHFDERVFLLARSAKSGLGAAYRAGFAWAMERQYTSVIQMDADLSHPPEEIPAMLRLARQDDPLRADVVIGSRYVPGGRTVNWPWHRQLISRVGNSYVRLVLRIPVRDATAGYRVYSTHALDVIGVLRSGSEGYSFQVENTWRAARAGLRIAEHPITFTEREVGESKMTTRIVREAIVRVLVWRLGEMFRRGRS
jgi:dolichol-phosphate mannosyltransferase